MEKKDFILASQSPQRIKLLASIGYEPKKIEPADIDESENKGEKATAYVKRMALEKAKAIAAKNPKENVLAADTVVVTGTKILHKAKDAEEQTKVMRMLSGKSHRVITAVCLIDKNGKISQRITTTKIINKRFSEEEIKEYVEGGSWVGSNGYKIEIFEAYVKKIIGSYSGVVGLPLFETKNLLNGAGIK